MDCLVITVIMSNPPWCHALMSRPDIDNLGWKEIFLRPSNCRRRQMAVTSCFLKVYISLVSTVLPAYTMWLVITNTVNKISNCFRNKMRSNTKRALENSDEIKPKKPSAAPVPCIVLSAGKVWYGTTFCPEITWCVVNSHRLLETVLLKWCWRCSVGGLRRS